LNKLKDSIEKIKRANSLLRNFIDEQEALRLNEIENEVSRIIKKLIFELSNPKDVIDFSQKMSNRELLGFLVGPEIFNEIKQKRIKELEKQLNDSNILNENKINDFHKSNELNQNKIKELEKQLNDSNNLNENKINDFHKSNELNQKRIKELEKQLNDSNNLYGNKINKLEIKLSKDFQLKLDELNQNKVNESNKKQKGNLLIK
jgi:hypothetical protein